VKAWYVGLKVINFQSSMLGSDKVEGEYGGFLSAPMSKGLCVSVPQKHFHAKSSGLEVGENGPKELW
jgi:hypothetical protein